MLPFKRFCHLRWFYIVRTFQGACQYMRFCYIFCLVFVLNRCMPMPQLWELLNVTGIA